MEIKAGGSSSDGIYRPHTVLSAVYSVLKEMEKGERVEIKSIEDVTGEIVKIDYARTAVSRASKDIGITTATRSKNNGYPLCIFRLA